MRSFNVYSIAQGTLRLGAGAIVEVSRDQYEARGGEQFLAEHGKIMARLAVIEDRGSTVVCEASAPVEFIAGETIGLSGSIEDLRSAYPNTLLEAI